MKFNDFVKSIKTHETTGFSSRGLKVTDAEANKIAEMCLDGVVEDYLTDEELKRLLSDVRNS